MGYIGRAPHHALWRDTWLCPPSASSMGRTGCKRFFPTIICGFIKISHRPAPALSTFPQNQFPCTMLEDHHSGLWAIKSELTEVTHKWDIHPVADYFLLAVTGTGSGYELLEHPLCPRAQPQTTEHPQLPTPVATGSSSQTQDRAHQWQIS